ncbi:hypothetical protein H0H93_011878 [Arthromyces matolae]|nr:hypothetical protein H0H93_011878 [Arthromyces matolae]
MVKKNLNYTGVFVSQPGPKAKKGHNQRTRKDILQDLNTCAMEHNGGTFTLAAWNLLDLLKDISRAKTHVLALTLRRTTSMNPRTLYELVDAEVLPMTFMDEFFANQRLLSDSSPVSPRQMLEDDAIKNQLEGAFGVAMVISTELPPGDNRSPRQALTDVCVSTYHAIGLFEKHKRDLEALIKPSVPKEFFVQSLRNALKGGTSRPTF